MKNGKGRSDNEMRGRERERSKREREREGDKRGKGKEGRKDGTTGFRGGPEQGRIQNKQWVRKN